MTSDQSATTDGRALRLSVLALVLAGLVLPILAGLWETAALAFGHLPAIGAHGPSLTAFHDLIAMPGFASSLMLTVWSGAVSTFLALIVAFATVATLHDHPALIWARRMITPILAAPHAALALGLAFLLASSGWIARALSPWATGWVTPPDLATVNDPWALALILGLTMKELPFFLLVILVALTQIPTAHLIPQGRSMGYGRGQVWLWLIAPQLYRLIRLPVYVVLAFALSNVDMALILGPTNPPTLAAAASRWLFSADTRFLLPGSAAALTLALIAAVAIGLCIAAERATAHIGLFLLRRGHRGPQGGVTAAMSTLAAAVLFGLALLALMGLGLWSVTWRWTFPSALPESWSLHQWMTQNTGWHRALATTLLIGLATTFLSLTLAILWLEAEDRGHFTRARWAEALIYLPLLIPQVAFLYGLNVTLLRAGLMPGLGPVIWAHVLFTFPYVMIALSDPWRALDPRLACTAAALGAPPNRVLMAIKLPCLLAPILTAAAIGFAVSVAQYVPTLFIGAGRITTLTTEAVTLASGADRRIAGTYGVLQAVLPLLAYATALCLPALLFRNRLGMSGGAR